VLVLPLHQVDGLAAALDLLFAETDRVRCGHRLLADRLFEVVLIQTLRWLLDHPREAGVPPGLVTGLSDPRLARALVALHDAPGAPWSVEQLAAVAGMSRTSFAQRFRDLVGQAPAGYLTDWRIGLAQAGLLQGASIKQLASDLGYANPSALSRAFAARSGHSPRDWLKGSVPPAR
jgi:AraC-like DNA-binding protein